MFFAWKLPSCFFWVWNPIYSVDPCDMFSHGEWLNIEPLLQLLPKNQSHQGDSGFMVLNCVRQHQAVGRFGNQGFRLLEGWHQLESGGLRIRAFFSCILKLVWLLLFLLVCCMCFCVTLFLHLSQITFLFSLLQQPLPWLIYVCKEALVLANEAWCTTLWMCWVFFWGTQI